MKQHEINHIATETARIEELCNYSCAYLRIVTFEELEAALAEQQQ